MGDDTNKSVLPFVRDKGKKAEPTCPCCGASFGPQEMTGAEPCYACQQFEERRTYAWVSLFPLPRNLPIEEAAAFADAALAEYDKRFRKRRVGK